ncbi:MAG: penicillin-binding transpeptidase domain-containing protein [Cellulosilyticaceae bacterium]
MTRQSEENLSRRNRLGKKDYNARNKKRLKKRLAITKILFTTIVIGLCGRITYLKLEKGNDYEKQVLERMNSTEREIEPQRGNVVDRNNKVVATSTIVYNVILDPSGILESSDDVRKKTYQALANYSKKTVQEIEKLVTDNATSKYKIFLKAISPEDMEKLKEQGVRGVWFEESFIRKYPKNTFAAQLIGFFNKNGEGQYGIEQQYNDFMTGVAGRIFPKLQNGNIVTTEVASPVNGNTVILTLDEVIQQYVEQTMNKYAKEYSALAASAIVMNPKTGEIYAMYSYPEFNPNTYTNLVEQVGKESWTKATDEERSAMLNRAWKNYNIQNPYEPGSTFKPLVVAMALEEGIINENTQFNCTGGKQVFDTRIPCWKTAGHGVLNVEQVLANSCNVGMMDIAEKIPDEMFLEYISRYGFGDITNVDLPSEAAGILHTAKTLGPVEKATGSMGQGFTATPLQMITALSAIVNGGYLLEPFTVSQVIDDNQKIIYEHTSDIKRQVISNEVASKVTHMLEGTLKYGTGVKGSVPGYHIGGKTGTAQKQPRKDNKHIVSFVGYAPINDPEVITLVLFDEIPEDLGVPSKAFKEIMTNVLPYMGIETDNTMENNDSTVAVVPDFKNKNIYEAIDMLAPEQLGYETIGVGKKVVSQYPAPGTKLPKNSVVKFYLETDKPDTIREIPDLKGLTVEEATTLVGDDFKISASKNGKIKSQIPKKGIKIEKGNQIIVQTVE